jgi:O-antigen ligase
MSKPWQLLFWGYWLVLFLAGSLALAGLTDLNRQLLLGLPLFLGIVALFNNPERLIHKNILKITLALAVFLLFGSFFSQNQENTRAEWINWLAGLSLFFFGALYKPYLQKTLPKILVGLGIFLGLYSLALPHLPLELGWLKPINSYNLVFPTYRLHNHLGDILVLPCLVLISQLNLKKNRLLSIGWTLAFSLLIFFSYSRSSYTAFAAGVVLLVARQLKTKKLNRKVLLAGALFFFASLTFLALTTKEAAFRPSWGLAVETKPLFNGRDQYWGTAFKAIADYPAFGVGPGNFVLAMGRYSDNLFDWTESSVNLFLNIAAENGLPAVFMFLVFIFLVIKNSRISLNLALLGSLLVNFQTDYTFKISAMWLLFWLLAGLGLKQPKKGFGIKLGVKTILLPGLITILLLLQISLCQLLTSWRQFQLAQIIYPAERQTYEKIISRQLLTNRYEEALWQLAIYKRLFRADSVVQYTCGNLYAALGKKQAALDCYRQAYLWNPYVNFDLYRKIYALENELNHPQTARDFLKDYQSRVKKLPQDNSYFTRIIKNDWREFNR